MNTTKALEEQFEDSHAIDYPGAGLARVREKLNISQEYIADKLHLRVAVIELLEADDYDNMPEPVFIKGYLRAYAQILDVDPAPVLESFNNIVKEERVVEKSPLWQTRKESNVAEYLIKWLTAGFAIAVIIAVSLWWHNSKDNSTDMLTNISTSAIHTAESELQITDLSNMKHLSPVDNKKS